MSAPKRERQGLEGERTIDEARLIEAIQKDPSSVEGAEAQQILFEQHNRRIYTVVYAIVKDVQHAEDLVQEIFLKAFGNIQSFHRDASFYTWLYRIASNASIDHLRREKRHRHDSLTNDEGADIEPIMEDKLGQRPDQLEERQLAQFALEAMDTLPENQRHVLELFLEGLSYKEIAEEMGTPEGTVMSRLFYARGRVRKQVEKWITSPQVRRKRSDTPSGEAQGSEESKVSEAVDASPEEPMEVSSTTEPAMSVARKKLRRLQDRVDEEYAQELVREQAIEGQLAIARDYLDRLLGDNEHKAAK